MNIPIKYKTGQAVVELAIFGSLILVVFSVMLTYSQRLDGQQRIKMEAFRNALQKAYYQNSSVTYAMKKHTPFVDLFSAFGNSQPTVLSASSNVMWQKGLPGPTRSKGKTAFAYYDMNGEVVELPRLTRTIKINQGEGYSEEEIEAPVGVFTEASVTKQRTDVSNEKIETGTDITNTQTTRARQIIETTYGTRFNTNCLDADGNVVTCEAEDSTQIPNYDGSNEDFATSTQSAWYSEKNNRIEYATDKPGDKPYVIQRKKTWVTPK